MGWGYGIGYTCTTTVYCTWYPSQPTNTRTYSGGDARIRSVLPRRHTSVRWSPLGCTPFLRLWTHARTRWMGPSARAHLMRGTSCGCLPSYGWPGESLPPLLAQRGNGTRLRSTRSALRECQGGVGRQLRGAKASEAGVGSFVPVVTLHTFGRSESVRDAAHS